MMKLISILATLCVGLSASAKTPARDHLTFFQQLQVRFANGVLPQLDPIDNLLVSGRCFSNLDQDAPLAAYFASHREMVDVGPISNPVMEYMVRVDADPSVDPAYFDSDLVHLNDPHIQAGPMPLEPIDSRTYRMTYPRTLTTIQFRQDADMIIGLGKNVSGENTAMCYFFRAH